VRRIWNILTFLIMIMCLISCDFKKKGDSTNSQTDMTAKNILGNPDFLAISYGGYRMNTRDIQPTLPQLKEDLLILHAMGVRILRTYNVQLPHASNVLKSIRELKQENPQFEMYVMLGAWIDCKNAWTGLPVDHNVESEQNAGEIARAVALANEYQDIVKVIAVGNEAMVKWAESYYVQPSVILKWVNHLQDLKNKDKLSKELWITSSDDFSSWGGGDRLYHVEDLKKLYKAVDYVSMHTYPMHNSHYNPFFWGVTEKEQELTKEEQINLAMNRALTFATDQYDSVKSYMNSIGIDKPIHIGETGWASFDNHLYGKGGSNATDELKEGLYYKSIRGWSNKNNVSCFYFEAFDEPWKDAQNAKGSENHFGLFKLDGSAKYAVWDAVDQNLFEGLTRSGKPIEKSYNGNFEELLKDALLPNLNPKMELVN
jgi:exo-beta-1,3-glucanase (GH17 family)